MDQNENLFLLRAKKGAGFVCPCWNIETPSNCNCLEYNSPPCVGVIDGRPSWCPLKRVRIVTGIVTQLDKEEWLELYAEDK